jgi:hypothetical protein
VPTFGAPAAVSRTPQLPQNVAPTRVAAPQEGQVTVSSPPG